MIYLFFATEWFLVSLIFAVKFMSVAGSVGHE